MNLYELIMKAGSVLMFLSFAIIALLILSGHKGRLPFGRKVFFEIHTRQLDSKEVKLGIAAVVLLVISMIMWFIGVIGMVGWPF